METTPENNLRFINEDLAPVEPHRRTWDISNYVALWIGMSFTITAYMLASSLMAGGMNWWQALLTIFVGNVIVLIPMLLNGHAGARYGIPFPVLARVSFGIVGANIPALVRALVACGWFGIQTWIGGSALYQLAAIWIPATANLPPIFPTSWQLATGPGLGFFVFWLLNMLIVWRGIEAIRKILVVEAILLAILSLVAIAWSLFMANGLHVLSTQFHSTLSSSAFWNYFLISLTGIVGYFSTICLNIPDFTRYARNQRSHIIGQTIALPTAITLVAFIGVITTSAASAIFGKMIWNPIDLTARIQDKGLVTAILIAILLATLVANISLNVVSPANDISNVFPRKISFKMGGFIAGVIGILLCPWKLIADPNGYIFIWLSATSGLLGSVVGILIFDYYGLRHKQLHPTELYATPSRYWYRRGINWNAMLALIVGILPNLPGFLLEVRLVNASAFPVWIAAIYHYAWFIGFILSGGFYLLLMKVNTKKERKL